MQKMQKLEIREGNKRTGHSSNSRFSPSACDAKNYDTSLDNVYNGHGFANTPNTPMNTSSAKWSGNHGDVKP